MADLVHFTPVETLESVGWLLDSSFVYVETMANYDRGSVGARRSVLKLLAAGVKDLQATLIGERTFDSSISQYTKYRAVFQCRKLPAAVLAEAHWSLTLSGAIKVTPPGTLPASAFCGLTTIIVQRGPVRAQQNPVNPTLIEFFRDVVTTTSDPNGGSSNSTTLGPLADLTLADVGTGASTATGESLEIWFEDPIHSGHYTNTHRNCSELPSGGSIQPEHTEGFNYITVEVWSALGYTVLPAAQWKVNIDDNQSAFDIIVPGKNGVANPNFPHIPFFRWHLEIPQVKVGGGEGRLEDLGNGVYTFRCGTFSFSNLVNPLSLGRPFPSIGTYPLTAPILGIVYNFKVATPSPAYVIHTAKFTAPATGLAAGVSPPITQQFL